MKLSEAFYEKNREISEGENFKLFNMQLLIISIIA